MFPSLARVGRLPDLAMTSSGAFPFAGTGGRMTLVVPTPDRATLGAALTVMARLGVAAGRQIPFSFATEQAAESPAMFSWSRRRARSIRRACGRRNSTPTWFGRPGLQRPNYPPPLCTGVARGAATACV